MTAVAGAKGLPSSAVFPAGATTMKGLSVGREVCLEADPFSDRHFLRHDSHSLNLLAERAAV